MKKRVLIITQIYLPEMGALSNRLYPIIRKLTEAGHEVAVATGMPNYPAGEVFEGYKGRFTADEQKDGHKIFRTNYYTTPRNRSKIKQLLSYISFMPAVFLSGIRAGKSDLVLITSPPIFPVIPALILAKLCGAKLVFDVRDLWSDELVTFGEMSEDSVSVRIARRLEKWGYQAADLVSATTKSLAETVIGRGSGKDKTAFIPNGAEIELFRPFPRDNPVAQKYDFGDRFVVMYSGLFGIKHGLETLIEAAEILRERKDIVFFLLGNGARRHELVKYIDEKSLDNVIIGGEVEVANVPKILSAADVCFASFQAGTYTEKIISVKIFEYLACEKPVVGAFKGESARVIEESKGGLVVAPGDARGISRSIIKLREDSALREKMGKAGRRYVEENFSRSKWASEYERMLTCLFEDSSDAIMKRRSEELTIETRF